ncbi:MAG: MBL fold metallo-hydrolase [Calditrichae bacterium]|nr:MBL fold metallo-hydrolase [Calditrichia bacterium]
MLKQVEITILSENRVVKPSLIAEQGLSFHIASPEGEFLFDTGHQNAFIENAKELRIDLSNVDQILFSHAHHDHTGGIYYYLQKYGNATIICHYNIFNRKFRLYNNQRLEVGFPYEETDLKKMGAKFLYKTHPFHLSEHILSSGEIPRITEYEVPSEIHKELVLESFITDELNDEMAMIINTSQGLIVLLGDGHKGPVNTVKHAMSITDNQKVYAVMGGMKLEHASEEIIEKITKGLLQINPEYIIPLHSTGFKAIHRFYHTFKDRLLLFNTGDKLTLTD